MTADSEPHADAPSTDGSAPQRTPASPPLRRTHPLTVAVKTARMLVSVVGFLIAFTVFGSANGRLLQSIGLAGLVLLATVLIAALSWLSWSRFTYGIVGSDLWIERGVLVRKRATIPLPRIQGVDVRADLFNRVLGLVELRVQTAGGGDDPEAVIGSVPLADAEVLRSALLRGHLTATETAGTQAPNPIFGANPVGRMSDFRGALGGAEIAREQTAFEFVLSPKRLVLSAITSNQITIILFIGLGAAAQGLELFGGGLIDTIASTAGRLAVPFLIALIVLLVVVGLLIALAVAVAKTWGFSARRVANRIETESGLLERRMTSVPIRRVQSVSVQETWLRRLLGYQAITVETAGFGKGDEQAGGISTQLVVPLARRDEIGDLMHALLPEVGDLPPVRSLPRKSMRFYMLVPTVLTVVAVGAIAVAAGTFVPVAGVGLAGTGLVLAGIVAASRYLSWRSAGIGTDFDAMTVQTGIIGSKRVRLGRNRIQSMHLRQTPFQRHAGIATVEAWSVSGSSKSRNRMPHVLLEEADAIVEWFHCGTEESTRPA